MGTDATKLRQRAAELEEQYPQLAASFRVAAEQLEKPLPPLTLGQSRTPAVPAEATRAPPAHRPRTAQGREVRAPAANRAFVVPPPERPGVSGGKKKDLGRELWKFGDDLEKVRAGLVDYYQIQDKLPFEEAERKAKADIEKGVLGLRFNVEGKPEYGSMSGAFPPARESRIVRRWQFDEKAGGYREVDLYVNPDGSLTAPTPAQHVVESVAKQEVLSPEKIGRMMQQLRQQSEDVTRQLNYDAGSPEYQAAFDEKYAELVTDTFDEWFSYTEPGTARTIETVTGAALRAWPAIVSTTANTGVMGYLPLWWEQKEDGEPVDPTSWAYRIHEALVDSAKAVGMDEATAREVLTGGLDPGVPVGPWAYSLWDILGGAARLTGVGDDSEFLGFADSFPEVAIPVPFQPVPVGYRTSPTSIDPYGLRVASATGNFIVDVATNLRRGRSMGDEFMAFPALLEERSDAYYRARSDYRDTSAAGKNTIYEFMGSTSPYWYGVGVEMLYGVGPFAAVKFAARSGEKALAKASKIANAPSLEKLGFVGAHPIQAASRAKTLRVVGDLYEGRLSRARLDAGETPLDILEEANSVRRVAGEYGAQEMGAPYVMLAYLNAAAGLGRPVKRSVLADVGVGESSRHVFDRARFNASAGGEDVTPAEISALKDSINRWVASAYRPEVERILVEFKSHTDAAKIRRIQAYMKEAGASKKVFPELDNPQGLSAEDWVASLFPADLTQAAIPISRTKPVIMQVHKLGADIARAGRMTEAKEATGPLGRIVSRRLGPDKLSQATIYDKTRSVAEASRASGGRAIESTIENVVPDDYTFVTSSLMAKRSLLTESLYGAVREAMKRFDEGFTVKAGKQKVDGRIENVVTVNDDYRDALLVRLPHVFGSHIIERSPDLSRIRQSIKDKVPITEDDKAFLRDAFATEAYREALRVDGLSSARDAVFGGRQAELAMVEGVNVRGVRAPAGRVRRRGIVDLVSRQIPMVISEGGGRQIMSAVRKTLRRLGKEIEEPPPIDYEKMSYLPMQRMIEELKNRVGSISDRFMDEVRAAAVAGRNAPGGVEAAFNAVVQKRIDKDIARSIRELEHDVDRLVGSGLSERDAWFRMAYTQAEDAGVQAVGREVATGDSVRWKARSVNNAKVQVLEGAWRDILRMYFGHADYERIQSAVNTVIRKGPPDLYPDGVSPDDILAISTVNIRDVISKIRKVDPSKKAALLVPRAGLATTFAGLPTSLSQDAITQVMVAFSVGRDRKRITQALLDGLRSKHPEMWVDLVPSLYSSRPDLLKAETTITLQSRTALINILEKVADMPGVDQASGRALVESSGLLTPRGGDVWGLLSFEGGGEIGRMFDKATANIYKTMSATTRKSIVDAVLSDILEYGTVDLNFERLLIRNRDVFLPFKTDATSAQVGKVFTALNAKPNDQLTRGEEALKVLLNDAVEKLQADSKVTFIKATENLAFEVATDIQKKVFYQVIAPAVREILSNARAMGFTPGTGDKSLNSIVLEAATTTPGQSVMLVGDDYANALKALNGAARDGRLIENLEMLRQADRLRGTFARGEAARRGASAWEFAKNLVTNAVFSTRTMAAAGLLAGGFYLYRDGEWSIPIPAPNLRYIGGNLLTAPLIALTTVGAAAALRAGRGVGWGMQARDVAAQVSSIYGGRLTDALGDKLVDAVSRLVGDKLVDAVSPRAVDDVVFTSETGRKWTWGELQDAMERNNIMMTRGSLEFQSSWMRDVLREARLTAEGQPVGVFRHFLRTVDPLRTNIFQYVANATDRAFRQNMFASALKAGMTEQQAAQMGRAVVLDYGRMPVGLRSTLNRWLLFIAFRASMTAELIEALARDGSTFNRQLLLMRDSQQASSHYVLSPDYAKTRLVIDPTEFVYDSTAGAMNYGPTHPAVDSGVDLLKMAQFMWHSITEDFPRMGVAAQGIAEENLHPAVSALIEGWITSSLRETDQGWRVPDVWAAWAIHNGPDTTWPAMKERYNIKAHLRKRDRVPGRPTVRGSTDEKYTEWYFTTVSDMRRFKTDLMLATYLGLRRSTEDWTKTLMAYHDSDYIDEKRRGGVPWFGFATGLMTPIGAEDPEQVSSRALWEQKRAAAQLNPPLEKY